MTYQINPSGPYFQWSDLPSLNSGDVVQFLSGYTYEKYDLDGLSGITIGAYGSGAAPIFSTLKTAVLTDLGSNLYECVDAELGDYLNMLVLDGSPRKKGRFPKVETEYFPIPSDSSDGSLNHGSLPFTASGEVVIRLQAFVTNTYSVTSDTAGVISFTGHTGQYPPKEGYGFALQNQIECLTEHGDWMYNSATKTITIYLTSPATVQYTVTEENLTITNCDNLIFSGLKWAGSNGDGINISNSNNFAFISCRTQFSGGMGWRLADSNCDDYIFTDCHAEDAFAGGFYAFFGCDRIQAISCTAKNIGMIEGGSRYMNYDGRSNGFCFEGGINNKYQNCLAEDIGFNGFVYGGNGCQVLNNVAKRFGAKKSDCGGFYTYNPDGTITDPILFQNNLALNGIGNAYGTTDETPNCQGFYFDNGTNGIEASGTNLSAFNPIGTYLHDTRDNEFIGITNYGNRVQLKMNNDSALPMTGNIVTSMWNVTTDINQEFVSTFGTAEEIAAFGTFNGNRYSNFKTGRPTFSTYDGSEPKPYRYAINPSVHYASLGETDYTLEDYDEIPYTIGTELGTVDYKTTQPVFGQFGYISGITPTYDENGVVITKAVGPKTTAFLRLGPTESAQWYLINGNCLGDFNDLQVDLELNYDSPASIVQNCKIDSGIFAIPLYSENTRANDQFYLLMEAAFDSLTFEDITFSEITVDRTESTAAIEIDEDTQSFIIALDGDIPTEVGEDEIIELSSPFTTLIELSSPFTTLVELNSPIR